jgi:hypothetical protein
MQLDKSLGLGFQREGRSKEEPDRDQSKKSHAFQTSGISQGTSLGQLETNPMRGAR